MLVNLTPDLVEIARRREVAKEHGFLEDYIPQSEWMIEPGIYRCVYDFNFHKEEFIEKPVSLNDHNFSFMYDKDSKFNRDYENDPDYIKTDLSGYGVADTIEQIKEYYKELIDDPNRKYAIEITPVFQDKENKGKGGGWRWHKWGPYIGTLNPQWEYIDDEDFGEDFKYVLSFGLLVVK